MPLNIGDVLLRKYRILELIGQGAFGRVYLAEEELTRRKVAIKELRHDLPAERQQEPRERFEREIEVGSRMDHPHIVRMITYERQGDDIYLVLEYMEGGSLRQRLDREGALPIGEAVRITIEICQALEYVHRHPLDLVHRDVTPRNILFAADGTAKLTDFGVVQSPGYTWSHWSGGQHQHPGDPYYRAPEARDSNPEPLRAGADVYMLGCVLWEILTGHAYKSQESGTTPSALRPEVPRDQDLIVLKAIQEDRLARYRTAREFRADLVAFQRALQKAELVRQMAEDKARREAAAAQHREQLASDYSEAERILTQDPERTLALLHKIRAEELGYPNLASLEARAQRAVVERKDRQEKVLQQERRAALRGQADAALAAQQWSVALDAAAELDGLAGSGKHTATEIRERIKKAQAEQADRRRRERATSVPAQGVRQHVAALRDWLVVTLAPLLVGILLGVLPFRVLFPVQYADANAYDLTPKAKADFVALVADSMYMDRNYAHAARLLDGWTADELAQAFVDGIDRFEAEGRADKAQHLKDLALILGIAISDRAPTPNEVGPGVWQRIRMPLLAFLGVATMAVSSWLALRVMKRNRRHRWTIIAPGLVFTGIVVAMLLFWFFFPPPPPHFLSYDLGSEARANYVALVADSFKLDPDVARVSSLLKGWTTEEQQQAVTDAIQSYQAEGRQDKVVWVEELAAALGLGTQTASLSPAEGPVGVPERLLVLGSLIVFVALVLAAVSIGVGRATNSASSTK